MSTEPNETDVLALSAKIRMELKKAASTEEEELPWGDSPALQALADRSWRTPTEVLLVIAYDWLARAERNPELFDLVLGAGPGAAVSLSNTEGA